MPVDHASAQAFAMDVVDRWSHPQVRALADAYLQLVDQEGSSNP